MTTDRHQAARLLADQVGIDLGSDLDRERQQAQREALRRALEDRLGPDETANHLGTDDR